ncbi:MAG TPA: dihydrodipicolinate synthase family protein [Actinomycetota bacterium]|jgi:dihydrodipicolinate synthase/N-acetylneuraminate lyase|nr:dihydrodipicolinate synthase family protein [Actinomycetota bacterium]
MTNRLHGAIAASVTPLTAGGREVDTSAIGPLVEFLAEGDVDGLLACGTTGEGVLLSVAERRAVTEAFVGSRPLGFQVAIHAGAQTTADTIALAAHAQRTGADAVAVIAPPYFTLDAEELTRHLVSAANASDPLPFYVYEFAGRSGYAIPTDVVRAVKAQAPNVVGMKVSDTPFEAVAPYLELGLDVFIGNEPLALAGMERGAVGCVSGLAAAFPEITAALVHDTSVDAHDQLCLLRDRLAGIPFHAALKEVLAARDVLPTTDVRPPLRGLTDTERATVLAVARELGLG